MFLRALMAIFPFKFYSFYWCRSKNFFFPGTWYPSYASDKIMGVAIALCISLN